MQGFSIGTDQMLGIGRIITLHPKAKSRKGKLHQEQMTFGFLKTTRVTRLPHRPRVKSRDLALGLSFHSTWSSFTLSISLIFRNTTLTCTPADDSWLNVCRHARPIFRFFFKQSGHRHRGPQVSWPEREQGGDFFFSSSLVFFFVSLSLPDYLTFNQVT
jgi:hypothetical protein